MPRDPGVDASTASLFTKVRSRNTLEETVHRLAATIKARLLAPGDRLPPERDLASRLGVSRSTLREALRVLVRAGYLEAQRGRNGGTFVARWPPLVPPRQRKSVLDPLRGTLPGLLDFRRAVEPAAAELAALRAAPAEVAGLEGILAGMAGAERAFETYRAGDARFHVGIARAARSPLILRAVTEVQTALTDVLDLIVYHSLRVLEHSTAYHWRILDAIRARHPTRARQLMLDHILATESIIRSLIPEADWPPSSGPEDAQGAPSPLDSPQSMV